MTEFNITNDSGGTLIITSLDNFSIANGVTKDMFAVANGNFALEDMIANEELQGFLDSSDISITDENGNEIDSVMNISGATIRTIINDTTGYTSAIDNYDPPGWANAKIVFLEIGATIHINGLKAGYHGETKLLINSSLWYTIELQHNDSSADAENRIWCSESYTRFKIKKMSQIFIVYDGFINMWKPILERKSG
jgi:hypothetical protein